MVKVEGATPLTGESGVVALLDAFEGAGPIPQWPRLQAGYSDDLFR